MRIGKYTEEIRALILRDAATPQGSDAGFLSEKYSHNQVAYARKGLTLYRANAGQARRYFLTQEAADNFTASFVPKRSPPPELTVRDRTAKARWDADTPPVITSQTKVTIAPPPPVGHYRSNWFKGQG